MFPLLYMHLFLICRYGKQFTHCLINMRKKRQGRVMIPERENGFAHRLAIPGFKDLQENLIKKRFKKSNVRFQVIVCKPFQLARFTPDANEIITKRPCPFIVFCTKNHCAVVKDVWKCVLLTSLRFPGDEVSVSYLDHGWPHFPAFMIKGSYMKSLRHIPAINRINEYFR